MVKHPKLEEARRRRAKLRTDAIHTAHSASDLSAAETELLEAHLKSSPDDLEVRTKLLGRYFLEQFESTIARSRRSQHILWIIEHRPESAVSLTPYLNLDTDPRSYEQAKRLWLIQIDRSDVPPEVIENAAQFFSIREPDLAEELLNRL